MHLNIVFTSDRATTVYGNGAEFKYSTPESCAFDVRAVLPEGQDSLSIPPMGQVLVSCGFKIQLSKETSELIHDGDDRDPCPVRVAGVLMPRSGSGSKRGLVLGNTFGLIDQDYQGEVMACVWHRPTSPAADQPLVIEHGERIAQYVLVPVFQARQFSIVPSFDFITERGEGGFGSTGSH